MKKLKNLAIIALILILGAFLVQAKGSSDFLANGFQALYYHSMRIEESFPGVNALGMALEEFDKAAKAGDSRGEAALMMGLIYQQLERPGTALGYYLEFAQKQPEEIWIYPLIGDLYYEMGRFEEAKTHYERALMGLEEETSFAKAYFGLGNTAFEKGDYATAKDAFEKALSDSGDYLDARIGLGKSLYYLAEYEEAVDILQYAQLQAPRQPLIHYYLGLSYEALGQLEQAEHSFKRMEELNKVS